MTTISDTIIYRRVAPILLACCLVLCIGAVVGTYVNDQNDRERDRLITKANTDRIAANDALLSCFDKFADDLAGGLPPVRAATVERDLAVGRAFAAIRVALAHAATAGADGTQLPQLLDALADVDQANAHLAAVRAANPYPSPPSTFCTT